MSADADVDVGSKVEDDSRVEEHVRMEENSRVEEDARGHSWNVIQEPHAIAVKMFKDSRQRRRQLQKSDELIGGGDILTNTRSTAVALPERQLGGLLKG